jgi:hypothetical protein
MEVEGAALTEESGENADEWFTEQIWRMAAMSSSDNIQRRPILWPGNRPVRNPSASHRWVHGTASAACCRSLSIGSHIRVLVPILIDKEMVDRIFGELRREFDMYLTRISRQVVIEVSDRWG